MQGMRELLAILVAVVGLWLGAGTARAETPPQYPPCDRTPSDGEVKAAKGLFDAGSTSFNEADYGRAIQYWEDAYRRDCTAHLLLMNLARAYELNQQPDRAVVALETYQQRNPGSTSDAALTKRIQKLKEQVAAEQEAARQAAPPPAPVVQQAPRPPPPVQPEAPASKPEPGRRSVVPLIVAGAGGAVMIAGGVPWIIAIRDVNRVEDECGGDRNMCTGDDPEKLEKEGNDARKRVNIFGAVAGVGAAATVAGLIWYFVQSPEPAATASRSPRTPHVQPELAPGYAGIGVTGHF